VVVSYWEKWSGFEADSMQAVVDDFNRSQGRIEVRFLSVSQVDIKLLLAASSGHPPDVAGLWSENIPDFSEKGALTPLDRGLARAGIGADRYVPLFWELCRHRGLPGGCRRRRDASPSSTTRSSSARRASIPSARRGHSPSSSR
jgi:multiple sugar transport system substrate-binding protein